MSETLQQALDETIRRKVQQFVSIVKDGHSYTAAWFTVTDNSSFGPDSRRILESRCVEAANKALALALVTK